jgi:NitT/TauT family transport system substrate-binding protein
VVRKALIGRALTLLSALVIGSTGVAAAANDTVSIGLGSSDPSYAIFFAGRELGFYSAANIDLHIQAFPTRAAAADSLAAGQSDLVPIAPHDVVAAQAKGAKERIVALFEPPSATGWYIMVPAGSPIASLADLKGKTVGVTRVGSPADVFLHSAGRSLRMNLAPTVPLTTAGDVALRTNKVDAAVMAPPATYVAIVNGDLRAILSLETALPPAVFQGIGATQDVIDKRPDVLKRWISATSKTVDYMQTHEAWTLEFLHRYFDLTDDTVIGVIDHDYVAKINMTGEMHADWMQNALQSGTAPVAQTALARVFVIPPPRKKRHLKL